MGGSLRHLARSPEGGDRRVAVLGRGAARVEQRQFSTHAPDERVPDEVNVRG